MRGRFIFKLHNASLAQCAGDIAALDLPWLGEKHLKGLLVGKFTDWRAVDGQPHAGSKMLPLKPIP